MTRTSERTRNIFLVLGCALEGSEAAGGVDAARMDSKS
jgi:hypothetical protein